MGLGSEMEEEAFVWKVNLLAELLGVLEGHPHSEGLDFWSWEYSADRIYSVKTVYDRSL